MSITQNQSYKLAISVGEPAGIGPDALLILFNNKDFQTHNNNYFIAFCDPVLLQQRAKILNIDIKLIIIKQQDIKNLNFNKNFLYIINTAESSNLSGLSNYPLNFTPGILNKNNSAYIINSLREATLNCLADQCDALITCPINKNIINQAGISFTGHTEYIAELSNQYTNLSDTPIMLLMGKDYTGSDLKVALITTHLPLSQICATITQELLIKKILLINTELKNKFNIKQPRILITGLNPHAGENGSLGTEELDIIIPAINLLKINYNINIQGPFAADSIFTTDNISKSDIIIAMYHDQGLTGFKARCFNRAANVTLGLPLIRTSVDHGTAIDLAGSGKINTDSLKFAIDTATDLINYKKHHELELRTSAA